jgi:hypothetical protein
LQVLVASEEAPAHATDLDENQHEHREYDYHDDGHGSNILRGADDQPYEQRQGEDQRPGRRDRRKCQGL